MKRFAQIAAAAAPPVVADGRNERTPSTPSDPALGRACHNQRKRFDLSLEQAGFQETRRAFYRALAAAGIGREAVVIAVKQ